MRFAVCLAILSLLISCGSEAPEEVISQGISVEEEIDESGEEIIEEIVEEVVEPFVLPHFEVGEECFPYPNERFMNWFETDSIYRVYPSSPSAFYTYLITHFDTIESKQIDNTEEYMYGQPWSQAFTNGITYERDGEGAEGGNGAGIQTSCTDIQAFKRTIVPIVEKLDPDNHWNKDSTSSDPYEAGCFYMIEYKSDNTLSLIWGCGC